ncbi:unnamed protein product [Echinostoma caproni]|uniref:Uncharacterized protein n=1 Tax=Echinostoma caproni TaxID=27848 RepID=A0A3P8GK32_9TREM|nr:unnamed protein product [Echinostoma caproni]
MVQGERSLLRWIDPQSSRLFCSNTLGAAAGDCNPTQLTQPFGPIPDTEGQKSYELRDATMGGRVLHIIDVDLENSYPQRYDWPRRSSSSSGSDQPAWSVSSEAREPFLSADVVNDHGCCSGAREPQATVAVWTTSDQFKTFLIHPRMFLDHSPNYFIRAVNRVHATVTQDPVFANPYIKPTEVFRRMNHVPPDD